MTKLAKQYSVDLPRAAKVFTIVFRLIKKFLNSCSDEECLQYTKHRVVFCMQQDNWSDEIQACYEATAVLERSGADAVNHEQTSASESKKGAI